MNHSLAVDRPGSTSPSSGSWNVSGDVHCGRMPGSQKFIAASGSEMLATLQTVHDDIEATKSKLKSGETDQHEALARALEGLQELAGVIEPLAKAYKRVHG